MQFEHFNISAPRPLLEDVKRFYQQVFALEEGFRPNFSDHGYWLYHGEQPIIHLSQNDERHAESKPGYLDHLAFRLTGIHDFLRTLTALNVPYRVKPVPQLNMQQVFLYDPTGIKLEVNFVDEV